MASAGLLLALLGGLSPAQTKELVVLPPAELGVKPPAGLDAWKIITGELKRQSRKHRLSMALQKKRHEWLIGPAREQARDCGDKIDCLAEIGTALGADVLVFGTIDQSAISLVAIQVKNAKRLGSGRSSKRLAKAKLERRAIAAARALVDSITKPPATAPKVAEEIEPPPPSPPPPVETEPERAPAIAEAEPEVAADPPAAQPDLQIDREVAPPPPAVSAAAVTAEPEEREKEVWTSWWFWTSLGAAVAAGATTAALLAGGAKGGPNIEGETGTIRGRY